ncbi:antitoxin VapB family protein [Halorussus salilacus]|uniref:antitoxin VapB family protein n=1 Tax=Halorussus salilacus TaxID=2953750 RepID=UPI00209E00D6|nr:antitoxin VapB family protein [Halorussus salilacus]USZ67465.1 antitoxin VapB family protein [Halorussus salilacus]
MGTKTISLADDAYDRLKAEKREGESFSDVVRRLTEGVELGEYYGVLSDETTAELEAAIDDRRAERNARRRARIDRLTDELE